MGFFPFKSNMRHSERMTEGVFYHGGGSNYRTKNFHVVGIQQDELDWGK